MTSPRLFGEYLLGTRLLHQISPSSMQSNAVRSELVKQVRQMRHREVYNPPKVTQHFHPQLGT